MNVNPTSLPDILIQPSPGRWPALAARLRQWRDPPIDEAAAAVADEAAAARVDIAATQPSWPRIFPGL